jgi:apolipoprotein D and lipocalin family protein
MCIRICIILFLPLFSISCQTNKAMIDTTTVKNVQIEKFMGTWYEIARFPHSFEKNLVGVTATYSLKENGRIEVLNQGFEYTLNGKLKTANGKAKIPNIQEPGKLKVSFFWIFYADYFILELDENYKWALIGSSSDKYLWILARSKKLDENILKMLKAKAIERGYDLRNLNEVQHN